MRPPPIIGIPELDPWLLDLWKFGQRAIPAGTTHGRYQHLELEATRAGYNAHERDDTGAVSRDQTTLTIGDNAGVVWTAAVSFVLFARQGAVINYAGLLVCVDSRVGSGTLEMNVYGEDADNIVAYVESVNNITNRTKTTAYTPWDSGFSAGDYSEIDVTKIVQEIIDRSTNDFGHHIGFIIEDDGSSTSNYLTIRGHENSNLKGPILLTRTET